MSRIGNRKIIVPEGVNILLNGNTVNVNGPKGELTMELTKYVKMTIDGNTITIDKVGDSMQANAMHGTTNANLTNMINGVKDGFKKELEIIGVGYKFNVQGNTLVINAGYSHPIKVLIPDTLKVEAVSNTEIAITGCNKVLLGEFAANVRKVRPPEPYKGKGIRYKDEHVRRKEGKKAA